MRLLRSALWVLAGLALYVLACTPLLLIWELCLHHHG